MDRHLLRLIVPVLAAALSGLPAAAGPQVPGPSPVTVAVRVHDAGRFVDGLTLSDFSLSEDGALRDVTALYRIEKNVLTSREGETGAPPDAARQFYLLFQMYDYDPKIAQALRYFFDEVLLPGDFLEIQTPVKSYTLNAEALARKPKSVLAQETTALVRKDINKGNFVYKSLLKELRHLVQGIQGTNPLSGGDEADGGMVSSFALEQILEQYRVSLAKLEAQQSLEPGNLVDFARALKGQPGRKFLILFYQQEFRPELSPQSLHALIDNNQDNQSILADLHELFQVYHRSLSVDVDRIVQAFCDSGADVSFLFIKRTPEKLGGVTMSEQSDDIFQHFSTVAEATGGLAGTTQNPEAELKAAVELLESYYLLAYAPGPGAAEGAFRKVSVAVKGKPYKVTYGRGYFAR